MAEQPPSNEALFMGLWREGLTDLQDIALNPWQDQVPTNDALGTIGHPTQAQATQEAGNVYGHSHDAYLDQVAGQEIEPPQQELERDD